ncbi:MAG: hypothetical protein E4H03_05765 [Myxococcales bacterium]|nr:MAG: hypothetical protein E4H03_05765 [Myxococcales bacterium]
MRGPSDELSRLLEKFRTGQLNEQQLLESIALLDGKASASAAARTAVNCKDDRRCSSRVVDRLDVYRAAEQSGADALEIWADLSDDAALVGGLRTAAAREARHAALLEQRLRELGGIPRAQIPDSIACYNDALTDPDATDLQRLELLVERFPDVDAAVVPLMEFVDSIEDDELTRELLKAICVDELATLRWAHEAFDARK